MQQLLIIAVALVAIVWHFMFGAGSCGRTPYGTAETFARTVASDPEACAERMEEAFPTSRGRNLCGTPVAEALRRAHKTYMVEESESTAKAVCFYGST